MDLSFYLDCLTDDQIVQQSVIEVKNMNDITSPKMGQLDGNICQTCYQYSNTCRGHYGHIPLNIYYIHPMQVQLTTQILQNICCGCGKFPIKKGSFQQVKQKVTSAKRQLICEVCKRQFESLIPTFLHKPKSVKPFTQCVLYWKQKQKNLYYLAKAVGMIDKISQSNLTDNEVYVNPNMLRSIFDNLIVNGEWQRIGVDKKYFQWAILKNVPLPGNFMRIVSQQTGTNILNKIYTLIVQRNNSIYDYPIVNDFILDDIQSIKYHWEQLHIAITVAMSKYTGPNNITTRDFLLTKLNISAKTEPASLLSGWLSKEGYGRKAVASARVDLSSRSVVGGAPYLNTNQVICPMVIAKGIGVPVRVNRINIDKLKGLVLNYPNYPSATRYMDNKEKQYTINHKNITTIVSKMQIGDIVFRHIIDGDVCMTNRYPSIREESFGSHVVLVKDVKNIQFPLSVIKKMGADFDGDEMQLFFFPSPVNLMEIAILSSMTRQFINYQNGVNIVGVESKNDLQFGLYHLNSDTKYKQEYLDPYVPESLKDKGDLTGKQLITALLPKGFKDYYGKSKIVDGQVQKIAEDLCCEGSQFLSFLQAHYGQSKTIQFMDQVVFLAYKVNEICGSTMYTNICISDSVMVDLQKQVYQPLDDMNRYTDMYYSGQINAPATVTDEQYYKMLIAGKMDTNSIMQQNLLLDIIQTDHDSMYNKLLQDRKSSMVQACLLVGQQKDSKGNRLVMSKTSGRTLNCFPKFYPKMENQGYLLKNYFRGLDQKSAFFVCVEGRSQIYTKGKQTAVDGYVTRRMQKGTENTMLGVNGIVFGDRMTVTGLQYGSSGIDPRYYSSIKFDKHKISIDEFNKQYKKHPRYDQLLDIRNQIIQLEEQQKKASIRQSDFTDLVVPFIFKENDVREEQLDEIFNCRLTKKMKAMKDIIIQQSINYYIYVLFFLEINPNSNHDIITPYLQSLGQSGDTVGIKAALASTEPYTQASLSAIHSKKGKLKVDMIEKTIGSKRFMELSTGANGPTIFWTTLIGDAKFDQDIVQQFVDKYQTHQLKMFNPRFRIKYSIHQQYNIKQIESIQKSNYVLDMLLDFDKISNKNVNLQEFIDQLDKQFKGQFLLIIPTISKNDLMIRFLFPMDVSYNDILKIIDDLKYKFEIGSGFLQNIDIDDTVRYIDGKQVYYVTGNLPRYDKTKNQLIKLLSIPGIDHQYTYCNNPYEYQQIFGIVKTKSILYNEFMYNVSTIKETQSSQRTHIKIFTDILTQPGEYTQFTRTSYRKDISQRDILQLMVFEQADVFLMDEMLNPKTQPSDTMLNAQVIGTRANIGSTFSQTYCSSQVLKQQNKKQLIDLMNK